MELEGQNEVSLKGNLLEEYIDPYTNKKTFQDYYKGELITEFTELPQIVYNEWRYWKNEYNRRMFKPVEKDTFDVYFQAFKDYWQFGTPETNKVFEEMKLLSDTLLLEWRYKYTFAYREVYENNHYMALENVNNNNKSKAAHWEEFKMIWDLEPNDYSEVLLEEYNKLINVSLRDYDTKYFDKYPRNFWEYRENANYHSFDSYSILKQFEICEDWKRYLDNRI